MTYNMFGGVLNLTQLNLARGDTMYILVSITFGHRMIMNGMQWVI